MKRPTIEQIKAHLDELEQFESRCEENCYTDTEVLWHYLRVSADLLTRLVLSVELEKIRGEHND